jgi:hypothetical protein
MSTLADLQAAVDVMSKRTFGQMSDMAIRSLTNAVNPDGSSGNVSYQCIYKDPAGNLFTVTVSTTVVPG